MESAGNRYRPWFLMAGAIMIQAGMTGIFINCTGVLFSAVQSDLNIEAGKLSIYYMIRSITTAMTVGTVTSVFFKYQAKYVMAILGAITCVSFMAMYFFPMFGNGT